MLALPILPFLLWSTPAHAEQHGLVVRLETGGEAVTGQAFILLTPTGGETTKVEVKNDGVAPDVSAGDGTWSGSLWLDGDAFTVGLEAGGKTIVGGAVSWNPDDAARDLSVSVQGETIVVEAGVSASGNTGGPGPGDAGTPPGDGGTPPGDGGTPSITPAGNGAPPAGGTPPSSPSTPPLPGGPGSSGSRAATSNDGTLYIGFGLGVLVLVGVAWLWLRNRPAEGGGGTPNGLVVVPEPGLLGLGTPSLSDGLGLWIVPEADQEAVVAPLLATLARHHRVLFAAPSRVAAPSVYGGPVYRATNTRPSHVGDAAEALQREGGAVAVLFVGTGADAATIRDYADLLPTGVGSICLVAQDPGVPAITRVLAQRDGGAWVVTVGDRTLRLVQGRDGFEEARISA